ncbi:dTDP-4-dehydrorhamnose 3,5-epimerase [Novosphingobium huizhouense]|uniref:dTDP-4-dehydrorhamnose 3,5-epimerase n=1 Tax=Novosphingobium huizhouense TaxID=2866625 RepID=UPI001CD8274C|nr:dTDP-4-dehydrorhamnose 3,5-epimerase [Novosphingobium huizhouense]
MTQIRALDLSGVFELVPVRREDPRGYFCEVFNARDFARTGHTIDFVQDNQSLSLAAGTVRGLHLQAPPHAQAKLVRVLRGAIFDVAVDLRPGSATYGRWTGLELSADIGNQLFIPAGFAHGFMTLTAEAEVHYKTSAFYDRESEMALRWDDPDLGIAWPKAFAPVLSDKDAAAPFFRDFVSPF